MHIKCGKRANEGKREMSRSLSDDDDWCRKNATHGGIPALKQNQPLTAPLPSLFRVRLQSVATASLFAIVDFSTPLTKAAAKVQGNHRASAAATVATKQMNFPLGFQSQKGRERERERERKREGEREGERGYIEVLRVLNVDFMDSHRSLASASHREMSFGRTRVRSITF